MNIQSERLVFVCAPVLVLAATSGASAATFFGADIGFGAGAPHPFSSFAAADFDAAATGPESILTYEAVPIGMGAGGAAFSPAPGVLLSAVNQSGLALHTGVSVDGAYPIGDSYKLGFDSTPAGSHFYQQVPATAGVVTVTFTFASPIVQFGSYITGLQAFNGPIGVFADSFHEMDVVGVGDTDPAGGGVYFFGFTDATPFSHVDLMMPSAGAGGGFDFWGLDDTRWVTSVPSPSGSVAALLSVGVLGSGRRRR